MFEPGICQRGALCTSLSWGVCRSGMSGSEVRKSNKYSNRYALVDCLFILLNMTRNSVLQSNDLLQQTSRHNCLVNCWRSHKVPRVGTNEGGWRGGYAQHFEPWLVSHPSPHNLFGSTGGADVFKLDGDWLIGCLISSVNHESKCSWVRHWTSRWHRYVHQCVTEVKSAAYCIALNGWTGNTCKACG